MSFLAGDQIYAADLNNAALNSVIAYATGNQTVTTTETDFTGASVTFTTSYENTVVTIIAVLDAESNGATDIMYGQCLVDGIAQPGDVMYRGSGRQSVPQIWTPTIADAGSHTAKIQLAKDTNSNTVTCYGTHSGLVVMGPGIS